MISNASAMDAGESKNSTQNDTSIQLDHGLNWDQCGSSPAPTKLPSSISDEGMVNIEADDAQLFQREDRIEFLGGVKIRQREKIFNADKAHYDTRNDRLDAEGNIYYEQQDLRLTGSAATLYLKEDRGEVDDVTYRLTDKMARGKAGRMEIKDSDRSHFEQVSYTTCRPGSNDWLLESKKLDIDQAKGTGVARGAKFRFKGVPIAYSPYVSFPLDDRRKSGFLAPSFGNTDRTGTDIAIPYYFNIAPNRDATLTPRVTTKRGLILAGEFRYLTESYNAKFNGEILPNDRERDKEQDNTRGAFSYEGRGSLAPNWWIDSDINYVSDREYLDDLGESLVVTSQRQLERRGDLRYQGDNWSFLLRLQDFQTVAQDSTPAYARLPQLLFDMSRTRQAFGLSYGLRSEYVYFDRSERVRGHRYDILPSVSLPMSRSWGYITPKFSPRYTVYRIPDRLEEQEKHRDRTTTTFSLDSGLFFERGVNWFGQRAIQTLEPRLFYLYTPDNKQDDLPVFDTSDSTFGFTSIFRENRFNGADRVGDANQLTMALTTRSLIDTTSEQLFRGSIGGIYYFRDREVQLPDTPVETDNSSSLVAEVAAKLSRSWEINANYQWNPHPEGGRTEKRAVSLQYRGKQAQVLNLSYRFTDELLEQTDLSASWPVSNRIKLSGRWGYSLREKKTLGAFAGIEYESCCWTSRLLARQFVTETNGKPDVDIMFQIELKGLTSIGDKVEKFLQNSIVGYS